MQVRICDLERRLQGALARIYVVSGDEPLQCREALDLIRGAARAQGHEERVRLEAGKGFDWAALRHEADTLSLFASKRLIDLGMPTGRPGESGAKALAAYAARPDPDSILLVATPKLDAAARNSRWYKALGAAGVLVQIRPIDRAKLGVWIRARATAVGLDLSAPAAELLAERVEGNMLACAQEIEKLALAGVPEHIDERAILAAVGDSARFDVYDLADGACAGDAARTARICVALREEDVALPIVVWALVRELRTLHSISMERDNGAELAGLFRKHRVWDARKRLVSNAVRRHTTRSLRTLLDRAAHIDKVVKGAAAGNAWDALLELALGLAGVKIFDGPAYNRRTSG